MAEEKDAPPKRDWKFPHHAVVRHVASGKLYGICERGHWENTLEHVYVYAECFYYGNFVGPNYCRPKNSNLWVRSASEFEDGRFELVNDCGFNG
jgi:hypothetical protein